MSNFESDEFFVMACTDTIETPFDTCDSNIGNKIFTADPNKTFFKNIMLYMDRAIREDLINAICFFKKKFGIDFSNETREIQPSWTLLGASLYAYAWPCQLQVELVLNNCGRTTAQVQDGGWLIQITAPGFIGILNEIPTYYPANTYFFFGFQKIIFPDDNSNLTFHYRSLDPFTFSSTSPCSAESTIRFQICNLSNRHWGLALGTIFLTANSTNSTSIQYRLVINFPELSTRPSSLALSL